MSVGSSGSVELHAEIAPGVLESSEVLGVLDGVLPRVDGVLDGVLPRAFPVACQKNTSSICYPWQWRQ